MTRQSGEAYSVGLLADGVHLVPTVAEIRWKEWGHPPEPTDLRWTSPGASPVATACRSR